MPTIDLDYINEAAAEAAIAALNRYAAQAEAAAAALVSQGRAASSGWQGDSYAAGTERVAQDEVSYYQQAAQQARAAAAHVSSALTEALQAETRAETEAAAAATP